MSKKVAISVVIPAFNEEGYIGQTLKSLKKQTFTDFEIIVVDNNCTDKTADIAKQYGARVVRESVQGMIPARERGYSEARADIIARTDADTIVHPVWLEKIFETLTKNEHLAAVSGSFTFPDVHAIIQWLLSLYMDMGFFRLTKFFTGHYPLVGPNHGIRKSAWQKITVHRDDTLVHEDLDLACHLSTVGSIRYDPTIQVAFSLRRWKRSFFGTLVNYTGRYIRTILLHHPRLRRSHV